MSGFAREEGDLALQQCQYAARWTGYLTYRAKDLSAAHELVLLGLLDAVEVEDELREQLAVVSLPLPNSLEVVSDSLRLLDLLGRCFVLTGSFELPGQGRGRGTTAANEPVAASFSIVDLDHLLLRRGLAVRHVALLARVRALTLPSCGRSADGRVGGILQTRQRHATICHVCRDPRRLRDSDGCHAWWCAAVVGRVSGAGSEADRWGGKV